MFDSPYGAEGGVGALGAQILKKKTPLPPQVV